MKHLSILIKPASSLCNLRCKYCFYADVSDNRQVRSYGVMGREVMERVVDHVFDELSDGDELTVAFQGGEPTLAGLPWLENFVSYAASRLKKVTLHYALQTNGVLLDDSWCAFLKEHDFLVGLSLDGPADLHNRSRVDAAGKGSYRTVMDAKRLLDKHKVEYNILCVLTSESARYPQQLWKFILADHIQYIQFTPCLDELDAPGQPWALTPRRFYSFYSALFKLWHREVLKGNYISVKLFDDIASLFVYRRPTACGITGRCSLQYVIEADGSVYPCDFYVLDQHRLGNLAEQSMAEVRAGYTEQDRELPALCPTCPYFPACGGGCKRMANSIYVEGEFCGWRALLDEILPQLCEDARRLAAR